MTKKTMRAGLRSKLMTTAALAGVGIASLYGRRAYAQAICGAGPTTYTCSGSTSDGQDLSGPNLQVRLNGGVDITTNDDAGLKIEGTGGITVSDTGTGSRAIYGQDNGLVIEVTGDAGAVAGSITVNTDALIESYDAEAVFIINYGTGAVTVTLNGDVSSTYDEAVSIDNYGDGGTTLTVSGEAESEAYSDAIYVHNHGAGDLNVTLTSTSTVLAAYDALDIRNHGDGDTSVSMNGYVDSGRGSAIENQGDGDISVTIGADSVQYANDGDALFVGNEGAGRVIIVNDGMMYADGDVIDVEAEGGAFEITNNGVLGIDGPEGSGMEGAVGRDAAGPDPAIFGVSGAVTNAGDIFGYGPEQRGIYVYGAAQWLRATNSGNITLTGNESVGAYVKAFAGTSAEVINTGLIAVDGEQTKGVYVRGTGDVSISNSGEVSATGAKYGADPDEMVLGVVAYMETYSAGAVTITNSADGAIYGTQGGILAGSGGTGDIRIENAGTISGYVAPGGKYGPAQSLGVLAMQVGGGDVSIDNSGEISAMVGVGGIVTGKYGRDGNVEITNSGDITGALGIVAGAKYAGDLTVDVTAGTIDAPYAGAVISSKYSGAGTFTLGEDARIEARLVGLIAAQSYSEEGLSITIDGDIAVEGLIPSTGAGIMVFGEEGGPVDIAINGSVTSASKYGILVNTTAATSITVAEGGRVATGGAATGGPYSSPIAAIVAGTGPSSYDGPVHVTVAGEVDSGPNGAQAIVLATTDDDTVELHGTFEITGVVDAIDDPMDGVDTLAFGGEADGTFDVSLIGDAEQFRGFESFAKEDGSTWVLTGANTDITAFAVNGGDLRVNGDLSAAVFTVAEGATLGGSGRLGTLTIDGIVAPGNSIGTLNVANITLAPTSVYEVEIAADGTSDLIAATGTAIIDDGAGVQVITLDPYFDYTNGQTYTILTAAGGVTGTFSSLADGSLFLDFDLAYTADSVSLITEVVRIPVELAQTLNQTYAAMDLQEFGRAGGSDSLAVYNSVLLLPAEDDVRGAFDSLSGEAHASFMLASAQSADLFQSTLARRAGSLSGNVTGASERFMDGASVWGAMLGQGGEHSADGNAAELEHNAAGLAFGAEGGATHFGGAATAGVAVGYDTGRGSVDGRASAADIDTWHVGGHAAWDNDALRLSGAAAYSQSQIESVRTIGWTGLPPRTATAERDGDLFGATLEAAYRLPPGPMGFSLAPVVLVDYLSGSFDAAQETGAGALNAAIHEKDFMRLEAGFGLEAAYDADLGGRTFAVEGRIVYRNLMSGRAPVQAISLEGAPGGVFGVYGPQQGDRITLGLGVSSDVTETLSLGARVDASVSDNGDTTRATLSGSWKF